MAILDGVGYYAGKYLVWQHGRPEIVEIETVYPETARKLGELYNRLLREWSRAKQRVEQLERLLPELRRRIRSVAGRLGGYISAKTRLSRYLDILVPPLTPEKARTVARVLSLLWGRYVRISEVLELGDQAIIIAREGLRARIEEYDRRIAEARDELERLRREYIRLRDEYFELRRRLPELEAKVREIERAYDQALREAERRKRIIVEDVDDNIVLEATISIETNEGHDAPLEVEAHVYTRVPRNLLRNLEELIAYFARCARYTVWCHTGGNVPLSSVTLKEGVSVIYDPVTAGTKPFFPEIELDLEYKSRYGVRTYPGETAECYPYEPYSSMCGVSRQTEIRWKWRREQLS